MNGLSAHGPEADLWWHLGLFHSSWQLAGTHLIGLMKKDLVIWQVKSLAWKPLFCSSLTFPEITGVEATCVRIGRHPQQCSLHQNLPPAFPWHIGVSDRSILRPAKCLLVQHSLTAHSPPVLPVRRGVLQVVLYQPVPRKGSVGEGQVSLVMSSASRP